MLSIFSPRYLSNISTSIQSVPVGSQAEDRAHRIGQTKGLTIDYFVAEGTLDTGMWRNLQSKLDTVGRTIDGHVHGTATGQSALIFAV